MEKNIVLRFANNIIVLLYLNFFQAEMPYQFLPSLTSQIYIYMYVCVYKCIRRYICIFGEFNVFHLTVLEASFNISLSLDSFYLKHVEF
jgi:hypothetical protein